MKHFTYFYEALKSCSKTDHMTMVRNFAPAYLLQVNSVRLFHW
jgi:hypothetical protein